MIFGGTNTDGHTDMIRTLKTTAPTGRSAVFGHCFAVLAALAGLAPTRRLCFCNPPPSTHRAEGTSRRPASLREEMKREKPCRQTQPLLRKADAKPKVRVRCKGKAPRRWAAQPSSISPQLQRVRFSVPEQAPEK